MGASEAWFNCNSLLSQADRFRQMLFMQQNAKAMVDIARKESDMTLKKELVQRLAMMRSKEATDYMMEVLNK